MGPVGYVSVILFLFFIFVLGFFIEDRINGLLLQGMRTNYPGVLLYWSCQNHFRGEEENENVMLSHVWQETIKQKKKFRNNGGYVFNSLA